MAKYIFLVSLCVLALVGLVYHAWIDTGNFFVLDAIVSTKSVAIVVADIIGMIAVAVVTFLVADHGPD
jgi:hypothetical protein